MKKRLFAGLLACLMVVGLLPLSMLLKPVSANAAVGKTMEFVPEDSYDSHSNYDIISAGDFNIYWKSSMKSENKPLTWADDVKLSNRFSTSGKMNYETKDKTTNEKAMVGAIGFNTNKASIVKVYWASKNTTIKLRLAKLENSTLKNVSDSVLPTYGKYAAEYSTFNIEATDELVTYYLGGDGGAVYIYKIVVEELGEEPTETKYDVTVIDSASTDAETKTTGKVDSITEGETFTLKASDTENFLYWVNSYGRIVSRDAEYSFPVYYSDTYTAVYKSAETTYKFMTDYEQVYKTYTASDLAIPTSPVKYGYEFDYWKIGETKVSTVEEIKAAGTDTDVVIKPVYKEVTENVSITINDVTKEYKKNEVVTADATALDNFMYWHVTGDESKILSYNDLYSFFADDKINSITAKCGTDTVEKSGIITHVASYSDGDSKTFVFEFTVPEGYTIEFAGVVASSTSTEPTLTDYEYIRGRSSSAQTYRYSWTKLNASNTTWNVRPILKYSDGQGNIMTIDTSTVQSL